MASKAALGSTPILLFALLITFIPFSSSEAPSPAAPPQAPATSPPCPVASVGAIANVCVNVFSNSTKPSGDCCSLLRTLVDVGVCLCDVLKIVDVEVDISLVVKLLDECENANTPSSNYKCLKS